MQSGPKQAQRTGWTARPAWYWGRLCSFPQAVLCVVHVCFNLCQGSGQQSPVLGHVCGPELPLTLCLVWPQSITCCENLIWCDWGQSVSCLLDCACWMNIFFCYFIWTSVLQTCNTKIPMHIRKQSMFTCIPWLCFCCFLIIKLPFSGAGALMMVNIHSYSPWVAVLILSFHERESAEFGMQYILEQCPNNPCGSLCSFR